MDTSRVLLNALIGVGLVIGISRLFNFILKGWRARTLVIRLQKVGKVSPQIFICHLPRLG